MKKCTFIIALAFILPLILTGCSSTKEELKLTNYNLALCFDDESMALQGQEEVEYFNRSNNTLKEIKFHLYPNAFREDAVRPVVPVSLSKDAYPNGKSYGCIEISSVKIGGIEMLYQICGSDKNILLVPLGKELFPDESVKLQITFNVKLANINHRLGYGENAINFANFYPVACVYKEGEGWSEDLYFSSGDPFYSEISNYKVTITYPENYTLATSGEIYSTTTQVDKKITQITAPKVRDFAFVLSDKFDVKTKQLGDTIVKYYGYQGDQNLNENLETSTLALQTYNEMIGSYPYKTLSIVKTNFIQGGMEYPNLVMISDSCVTQSDYDYVIAHEIAHQWWYGVVGNDQFNNAWQDESLTEFSTWLFFKKNPKYNLSFEFLAKNALENYKFFEKVYSDITGNVDTSMNRPLDKFPTEPEYVQCIYTKGPLMYHTLYEMVGEKKFTKAMRDYYNKFAYRTPMPEELISSFSKSTGYNLEGFFNSWLSGEVVIY